MNNFLDHYLGEHLNITVQITDSSIQVPNQNIRKELARYTNMFIQAFRFEEFSDLDKTQLKMINDNSSQIAYKFQQDATKILVAARRDCMNKFLPQHGLVNRKQDKTTHSSTLSNKPSSTPTKQDQPSTIPIIAESTQQ